MRAHLASTGRELDAELDVPPASGADWTRITVEEVCAMERARLEQWRDRLLACFDAGA